jgi:hypothetical protein
MKVEVEDSGEIENQKKELDRVSDSYLVVSACKNLGLLLL